MIQNQFPAEPVLLKGATSGWRAHHRWTWDFLAHFTDEIMELTDKNGEPADKVTLNDYLHSLHTGDSPQALLYASGWRFFERHPDMLADFNEPEEAIPDILQNIPQHLFKPLLWAFIGPQGSGTTLHYDVLDTHAWLAVIRGRKRIALHPPTMILGPDNYNQLRADALTVLAERCGQGSWRYVELEPGDLLLIPSRWWHEVINEGRTLGLTRNFATPDIHELVAQAASSQGLISLYPWLETRLEKVLP